MPVARHTGRGAFWLAVTIAVLAFVVAGCGSDDNEQQLDEHGGGYAVHEHAGGRGADRRT